MSSSDIFDVLNIKQKDTSLQQTGAGASTIDKVHNTATSNITSNVSHSNSTTTLKPMGPSKPQVTGIQRELYNLLGENQPPIMIQPVNRFKERLTGKPSPWTLAEFWSNDSEGGETGKKRIKLRHWVKGSRELIGDSPQESTFNKFNQHLTLPDFTKQEYEQFTKLARERAVDKNQTDTTPDKTKVLKIKNSESEKQASESTNIDEPHKESKEKSELGEQQKEEPAVKVEDGGESKKEEDSINIDNNEGGTKTNDEEKTMNNDKTPRDAQQSDQSKDSQENNLISTSGTVDSNEDKEKDATDVDAQNKIDTNGGRWSFEEVDYLFQLCRRFDLRWFIIYDRYDFESPECRTLEDLKSTFYETCQNYFAARNGNDPLLQSLNYDKDKESERKQYLQRLLSRSAAEIAEEEALIIESKKFEMAAKKTLNERESLLRLLDSPNSDQNVSQYMTSQGISQLYNNLLADKSRKRKNDSNIPENPWMKQQQQFAQQKQQLQQLHEKRNSTSGLSQPGTVHSNRRKSSVAHNSMIPSTHGLAESNINSETSTTENTPGTDTKITAGISPRKTKRQKLELQNALKRKSEAQYTEQLLQDFTSEERKALGVIAHGEKLSPGVYLRSTKISTFKPALQNKVIAVLQELGLPMRPSMPSYDVIQMQEQLLKQVVTLLELKKQADKLDAEKAIRK